MVEERITDGKRIAQHLSSEIHGRSGGVLGSLSIVDADPGVEPSEPGTHAYRIERNGRPFVSVTVEPNRCRLEFLPGACPGTSIENVTSYDGLSTDRSSDTPTVIVEYAAAVKRAVDVIRVVAEEGDPV